VSDAQPAPPAIDAVVETVQRLWPGAEVDLVGRAASVAPEDLALTFVPHARSPRLLVPAAPPAAARSMLRFSAMLGPRDIAERLALAAALAAGAGRLLPDRLVVRDGARSGIAGHLFEVLGTPVQLSLGIGTARTNRKPVLGVFDRAGRALGYAKVADRAAAVGLVRGEAEALRAVGDRAWRVLDVPRVLHAGDWEGMALLVMSALATPPTQRPSRRRRPPLAAMEELARSADAGTAPLAATPAFRACEALAATLAATPAATPAAATAAGTTSAALGAAVERFRAALAAAALRHGEDPVRVGAWHGDLTPWNLARRGRRVQLWDWERYATGAPVGFDRVHFAVNTLDRGPLDAAALDARLSTLVGDAAVSRAVVVGYLASIAARYLEGVRDVGGDDISARSDAVVAALERWSTGDPERR
jgi:hypothetical protein